MTQSEWLAAAAFGISLAALSSNLVVLWLKWPRIVVEVSLRTAPASAPDAARDPAARVDASIIVLCVINNGSEAVTLKSVGLENRTRAHRLDYLDTWHGATDSQLPAIRGDIAPPAMPVRVEAHACAMFEYRVGAVSTLERNVEYHGYATRYRAFRWRPNHPMVRETTSRHAVIRRYDGPWTNQPASSPAVGEGDRQA